MFTKINKLVALLLLFIYLIFHVLWLKCVIYLDYIYINSMVNVSEDKFSLDKVNRPFGLCITVCLICFLKRRRHLLPQSFLFIG